MLLGDVETDETKLQSLFHMQLNSVLSTNRTKAVITQAKVSSTMTIGSVLRLILYGIYLK